MLHLLHVGSNEETVLGNVTCLLVMNSEQITMDVVTTLSAKGHSPE